ncbi:hypothetical protein NMY22_g3003 [Coprinellus aureogranulatus]|nr:hypothetical protein NMY22_g3003 [Coprinellus aureogranulatus]
MVHLVPSREDYTSRDIAELVFSEVYKHHGLPRSIVSDRDKLFTATFWDHLHSLIGTKLRMSSAYHPETDGVTERANRTITQMIRQCIGPKQRDWALKLPAVEFAINSARSETTGYSPFFLNYGRMPRSFIWNSPGKDEFPGVRAYVTKLKNAIMSAHDSIIDARVKQTRSANRRRQLAPFTLGDMVYVSSQNIKFEKGLARKFLPKYIGPYKIIEDFGNNSYRLDLPKRMTSRGVHNVFHASLLRMHYRNDDQLFPGRTDNQIWEYPDEESEQEYPVEKILSHKGARSSALFELLWKDGEKSWLPYHKISHLGVLREYLEAMGVSDISELSEGNGNSGNIDEQIELGYLSTGFQKVYEEGINIDLGLLDLPRHDHSPSMSYYGDHGTYSVGYASNANAAYNPIYAPQIENLVYLGNNRFMLISQPTPASDRIDRVTYYGQQIGPYFDVADQLLRKWENRLPLVVEPIGGYNEFAAAFNSKATWYAMPTQYPNGQWHMPEHCICRSVIDIDFLLGNVRQNDPIFEHLGFTRNGMVDDRSIRGYIQQHQRNANTNARLLTSVSRMMETLMRTQSRSSRKKSKHHRTNGPNPQANAAAAAHRRRFGNKSKVFNTGNGPQVSGNGSDTNSGTAPIAATQSFPPPAQPPVVPPPAQPPVVTPPQNPTGQGPAPNANASSSGSNPTNNPQQGSNQMSENPGGPNTMSQLPFHPPPPEDSDEDEDNPESMQL